AVYLGNQELIHKKSIMKVFDGLAWLMQIVLFLTLGLLVFPSAIIPVFGIGMIISLFLIFVARPISVFISLIPFKMTLRRRFYICNFCINTRYHIGYSGKMAPCGAT